MSEHVLPILVGTIGAANLIAAIFSHRVGNDKCDIRLLTFIGGAMSGLALILFSLSRI